MSSRFIKVAGFMAAGATLILLADVAPGLAVGTALLALLGVFVYRSQEVTNLISLWRRTLRP